MKLWRVMITAMQIVLCSFVLAGCWSRVELNELAITSATSIDRDGEEYVVTFQVLIPSAISTGIGITGGSSGAPVVVYSTKGRTIREADLNSLFESPRRLYFAHNRVILLSEETVRKGLNPVLDVYLRNPDARETVDVLVTPGRSRKVLEQMMQIQKIPGDGIRELISIESKYLSWLPEVKLYELAMELSSDSAAALLPEIYVSGTKDASSVEDFSNTTLPSKLRLGRAAVIKKDKMVGWLSRSDALGVAFLKDAVKQAIITTACPEDGNKSITFGIERSVTELKPSLANGKLHIKATVKSTGKLTQIDCKPKDLYNPETVAQLEKAAGDKIYDYIESGWHSVQAIKADVPGFADLAHRTYRKEWRKWQNDWDSVFADIQLQIEVEFKLTNVGLSNQPVNTEKLRQAEK